MKKVASLITGAVLASSVAMVPVDDADAFWGSGWGGGPWYGGGPWGGYPGYGGGWGGYPGGWGGHPGYGGWGGYPYAVAPTTPATTQAK